MNHLTWGAAAAVILVSAGIAASARADTIITFNVSAKETVGATDTIGGSFVVDTTTGAVVSANVTDTGVQTGPTTFAKPDTFTKFVAAFATNGTNIDLELQDTVSKNTIQLAFTTATKPGSLVGFAGPGTGVYEIDDGTGNFLDGAGGLTVTAAAATPPGGGSNAVPEPGALVLLVTGLFALAGWGRRGSSACGRTIAAA